MIVKISNKSLLQKFAICNVDYIKTVCNGSCCNSSNKLMVTVHDSEKDNILNNPFIKIDIEGNFIKPNEKGLCPFKNEYGLCVLHNTIYKPFGCIVSPFTLNKNNTLIVRNRYRLLKCYRININKTPVYIAHKFSLVKLFGESGYDEICNNMNFNRDFFIYLDNIKYSILKDNDNFKKNMLLKKHKQRDFINGKTTKE